MWLCPAIDNSQYRVRHDNYNCCQRKKKNVLRSERFRFLIKLQIKLHNARGLLGRNIFFLIFFIVSLIRNEYTVKRAVDTVIITGYTVYCDKLSRHSSCLDIKRRIEKTHETFRKTLKVFEWLSDSSLSAEIRLLKRYGIDYPTELDVRENRNAY